MWTDVDRCQDDRDLCHWERERERDSSLWNPHAVRKQSWFLDIRLLFLFMDQVFNQTGPLCHTLYKVFFQHQVSKCFKSVSDFSACLSAACLSAALPFTWPPVCVFIHAWCHMPLFSWDWINNKPSDCKGSPKLYLLCMVLSAVCLMYAHIFAGDRVEYLKYLISNLHWSLRCSLSSSLFFCYILFSTCFLDSIKLDTSMIKIFNAFHHSFLRMVQFLKIVVNEAVILK